MIRLSPVQLKVELDRIRGNAPGYDPVKIVETARKPKDPLHQDERWLGWDEGKLAYRQMLDIARNMVRTITIEVQEEPVRGTISLRRYRGDKEGGGSYRDTEEVMRTADLRRAAAEDALADLLGWRERHKLLTPEFDVVFTCIDSFALETLDTAAE